MASTDVDLDFGADFKEAKQALDQFLSEVKSQGAAITGALAAGAAAAAAAVVIGALTAAYKYARDNLQEWVDTAAEAELVQTRLGIAVRNAGEAFQWTAEQLAEAASAIQERSMFGDETIKQAQQALIQIGLTGQAFKDAQQIAVDMASVMGQDLSSAAFMLGRALQDPERGMMLLRRQGVILTQSQQEMIKKMSEAGDVAGAQALLIAELQRRYHGAGEEIAGTVSGQFSQIKEIIGDIAEELGGVFRPALDAILPVIKALLTQTKEFAAWFNEKSNDFFGPWVNTAKVAFADLLASVQATAGSVVNTFLIMGKELEVNFKKLQYMFSVVSGGDDAGALKDLRSVEAELTSLMNGPGWSERQKTNFKALMEGIFGGPKSKDPDDILGDGDPAMNGPAQALKDAAKDLKDTTKNTFSGGFEDVQQTFERIQSARTGGDIQVRQLNALEKQIMEMKFGNDQNAEQLGALMDIKKSLNGGVNVRLA